MAGSFIIGAAVGLTARLGLGPEWQTGLATGLAGGLTTFSSWTTATVRLVSETRYRAAAAQHRRQPGTAVWPRQRSGWP